ncbi:hypothetical protein GCM10011583_74420 [Streptomyces camponoticapitis]|uniref:Uncharacterized protein n=1 Tax=Streptomyces camponoticapitis TaxID=1616125 RepID=A0ABQ2F164_9ACTN|nr:hypothetical protein GCM10011583_74420 [Streptomyces camponoticapitis]
MSEDYDWDDGGTGGGDASPRSEGGGGYAASQAAGGRIHAGDLPATGADSQVSATDGESEDGWTTLRVAAAAGGGILVSAFLGAVGARLGEHSVQGTRDRLAQRRGRAGTREGEAAAHSAFLNAVGVLSAARASDGGVLRLSGANGTVILMHPSLPPKAIAQFARLDLADPEIAGLRISWEGPVGGYDVHGVWAESRDVWATSYKRVRVEDSGQERALRYVWNDRVQLWRRRSDEPFRPGDDGGTGTSGSSTP